MRFVKKGAPPDFFENAKIKHLLDENKKWDDIPRGIKSKLKNTLRQEQSCLCIYCEGEIPDDKQSCYESIDKKRKLIASDAKKIGGEDRSCSHIEHIRPKGKFPSLTFTYENLVLSCEGIDDEKIKLKNFCGHHKDAGLYQDEDFDETKFINPVQDCDSANYFAFYADSGGIYSSGKDDEKANYMINRLNLDATDLSLKRMAAKRALEDHYMAFPFHKQLDVLMFELNSNREYISFLRYCFLISQNEVNL